MNGTVSPEALAEALGAFVAAGLELPLINDEWLTVSEAITEARVSRTRLYEWMRDGLPFLDETPRQIRRSALLQFKTDREVVMVRGKKVSAPRMGAKEGAPPTVTKRPTKRGKATTDNQIGDRNDRASLLALVKDARKVAA